MAVVVAAAGPQGLIFGTFVQPGGYRSCCLVFIVLKLDVCFSPDLLPLYDLQGKVAVIVDVLRATSTIVTALAQGVTEVFPTATLEECAALGRDTGCITAAERDGVAAAGFDLGNSPFGFLDGKIAVQGRALAISTTSARRPCAARWPPRPSCVGPSST